MSGYLSVQSHVESNISATTSAFDLRAGQYGVTVIAGNFNSGTVTLQRQAADNSTWVTCLTAFAANGYATVNLPNGSYRLAISSATGVYADITSIAVPV